MLFLLTLEIPYEFIIAIYNLHNITFTRILIKIDTNCIGPSTYNQKYVKITRERKWNKLLINEKKLEQFRYQMSRNIYQWSESGKKLISVVRKSNELLNIRGEKVEPIRY